MNNIPPLAILNGVILLIALICLITSFVWQKQEKVVFIAKGEVWAIVIGGMLGVPAVLLSQSGYQISTLLWIGVGLCFIICVGFTFFKNKGVGAGKIITMIIGKACFFLGFVFAGICWLIFQAVKTANKN